ncbi:MAG: hypothetical protein MI865_11305 [Proteobacteria bacterium]|nr:hypothetical protein [Pseudomonadota bacterium]
MKNYTNNLVGLLTAVVLSTSSNAFADSIHSVLDENRVNEVTTSQSSNNYRNTTPRTLQEYVAQFQNQNGSPEKEPTPNYQAQWTALDYIKAGRI